MTSTKTIGLVCAIARNARDVSSANARTPERDSRPTPSRFISGSARIASKVAMHGSVNSAVRRVPA
jgi:hypothetical protein